MLKGKTAPTRLAWLVSLLTLWATPAGAQPAWVAPPEPPVHPQLPRRVDFDADNNRIDDRLDDRIAGLRRSLQLETVPGRRQKLAEDLLAPVRVEVVFDSRVAQKQIDDFVALGGTIDHVFRAVSYGWTGTLPGASLDALPTAMGDSLLVVAADAEAQLHMDEATRTGRVRNVWARGFAGEANGLSGTSDITIGIVDSGVDDSHTDLSGRNEFWKDYTSDGEPTPKDIRQHGSHVTGIALGSGNAFGAGGSTLKYTDSGDLTGVAANSAFFSRIHLPPLSPRTVTMSATFNGVGTGSLRFGSGSNGALNFLSFDSTSGSSPLSLTTIQFSSYAFENYSSVLVQNSSKGLTTYAIANSAPNYTGVGDGFNAFRGVAPGSRWAGAKVFTHEGSGSSATISAALDDLVSERVAHNIKVVNMSLGIIGAPGLDPTLRAKVNTLVNNGIVAVCSAGNDGPGSTSTSSVDDPGRAALAITVGAANDINGLTRYSSAGFASPGSDEDFKPDLLAPGGSDYHSQILSVDSNDGDTGKPGFSDRVANDLLNIKGTSMAAPFTAGAAALMIDAMQKSGTTWGFASSAQPLFVKMLLGAGATETNTVREGLAGNNPTLGRAAAPKDLQEGYGLLNVDASVEAVLQSYDGGTLGGTTDGGQYDRRAWGRRIDAASGGAVTLTLDVPATADYDLYLYSGTPDAKGNPVIVASSTNVDLGADESLTFVPTTAGDRFLFVKRVSGSGSWSLTSATATSRCGDGNKTADEQCDDGNLVDGDCCSAKCAIEANGSPCDDGLFCTATDSCSSGACKGSGDPCATAGECRSNCNETADACLSPGGTACTADALPCTVDQCDGSGNCVHTAGNAGTVCRASAGVCDVTESCSGTSTACPPDGFGPTSTVCRSAAGVCDVAESCNGFSAACPADTFAPSSTVCRTVAGVCDVAESCTGSSATCPANGFLSASNVCRTSAGVCDTVETCSGVAAGCPVDAFATSTVVCRASAGVCDAAETCPGNAASCPADAFATSATVCRASTGVCDAAESCSGTAASCPGDAFAPSSTVCRAANGVCDVQETCTGSSASCPANGFAASTTVCRASAGVCDAVENCSGTAASCPADAFAASTTVCRTSAGVCDAVENCSGTAAPCPANAFAPSTTVCRTSAGICDAIESCTGASASCPADAFAASTTVCRSASGVCDAAESCTGTGSSCPADGFALSTTVCRAASGACDVAESCTGTGTACPADGFASSTVECRAAAGVCDVAEFCTGTSSSCPVNTFVASTTTCRGSAGVCDAVETCTGSSAACPADAFASAATVCRGSAGICDAVENCSGSGASCPADGFAPSSTVCRSASGVCDVAEACTGSGAACPADAVATSSTVCRSASGVCDVAESCTGAGKACPADGFASSTQVCRGSAGVCDAVETCSGSGASCPADGFAPSSAVCRSSGGVCDVQETCSGASASCPADGFASSATVCRGSAGVCDAVETCSGSGVSCPADAFAQPSVVCRGSAGICDAVETCSGTAASCPADAFSSSANVCRAASGVCDVAESCSGSSASCPADAVAAAVVLCRGSAGECDLPENCNGTAKTCPANAFVTSGTGCSNDSNVCTTDVCDGSSATCRHNANTLSCQDGVFCNGADTCSGGSCAVHAGNPCPGPDGDGNCAESCDETADACSAADLDGSTCSDSVFCNGADTCTAGACATHAGNPCPGPDGDGNCTESCNEAGASCTAADTNGAACNDGLFCTARDACSAGNCVGTGDPCPGADGDGNCTESCNEAGDSCSAPDSNGTACDDGLFCTANDVCSQGACVGSGSPCAGADGDGNCSESCDEASASCTAPDAENSACSDGLFCNGADACSDGICIVHAGNPCAGADGDANCSESCSEPAGACTAADPDSSACDDGLACTTGDVCEGGVCVAAVNDCGACGDGSLDAGETCDDGNTADGDCCSSQCKPVTNGASCDDGVYCNGKDTCQAGTCSGHAGNPCPGADGDDDCSEGCNEAADDCSADDAGGSACNDGAFCNGADTCAGGACVQHAGNPCVGADGDGNCAESCNEAADHCQGADPNGSACDDALFCNGADTCTGGVCAQHAGSPCVGADGDGNCAESCDEGADHCAGSDPNGSACDDGIFCNGTDSCASGACIQHAGSPCAGADGDGNCAESCNELGDLCDAADPNGAACDDGVFCNGADTCTGGSCASHGGNPCPGADGDADCLESCDEASDLCLAADPDGSFCDDGLPCTIDDACDAGLCTGDASVAASCGGTTTTTVVAPMCGDTNDDGRLTSSDALRVLRAAVGGGECPLHICDFNGDGRVSASDALGVLRSAVGQTVSGSCPHVLPSSDDGTLPVSSTVSSTVPVTLPLTSTTMGPEF